MGNTYGKFDGNKSRLLSRYTNFRVRIRVSISRWIFELSSGLLVQNMGRIVTDVTKESNFAQSLLGTCWLIMQGVLFKNGSKYSGGSLNGHARKRKALFTAAFTKPRLGNFKIQLSGRQREREKNKRFNKQNNNFARASRFFVHFL